MSEQPRKLSEIPKEMAETLLRDPGRVPSSEPAHVALLLAHAAWNESVGLGHARDGYRHVWETIQAENPQLWNEFRSDDVNALIDDLVRLTHAQRKVVADILPELADRLKLDEAWLDVPLDGQARGGREEQANG